MKTCRKCNRELPLEEFHARGENGRASRCRDCCKEAWNERPNRLEYTEPPKEKPCTCCKRTLPIEDFPRNNYNKTGLGSRCRSCCAEDYKNRLETHVAVPVTEKPCRGCKRTLDASSFGKKSSNNDGLSSRCKDCMRLVKIEHLYKISPDRYAEMVKGGCQICGTQERLVVDHDHACCNNVSSCGKCIRGILCDNHNSALGRFNDDPALLLAAVEYLTQ